MPPVGARDRGLRMFFTCRVIFWFAVIANVPVEIVTLLSAEKVAVAAVVRPSVKDVVQEERVIVEKSKPTEGKRISITL